MAAPWRHPDTGVCYLRRHIPKTYWGEFGGRRLWKRSLDTKDADEARRLFPAANAELEQMVSRAKAAVAERTTRHRLTPAIAVDTVNRMTAAHRGGRVDRFLVLANIFWAEDSASTLLGSAAIGVLLDPSPQGITKMDATHLPGDLWAGGKDAP